eukprot:m.162850 g.162850  ORF g.162850 m.162850 type:complete len:234 (-) comp23890_c0_seq1:199-900(-)
MSPDDMATLGIVVAGLVSGVGLMVVFSIWLQYKQVRRRPVSSAARHKTVDSPAWHDGDHANGTSSGPTESGSPQWADRRSGTVEVSSFGERDAVESNSVVAYVPPLASPPKPVVYSQAVAQGASPIRDVVRTGVPLNGEEPVMLHGKRLPPLVIGHEYYSTESIEADPVQYMAARGSDSTSHLPGMMEAASSPPALNVSEVCEDINAAQPIKTSRASVVMDGTEIYIDAEHFC